MRWDNLFAELEAEFDAAERDEAEAEIIEMVQAEMVTVSAADRFRAKQGSMLTVRLRNGENRSGEIREANLAWIMLHDDRRRYLIPYSAIAFAWPLAPVAGQASGVSSRLTLGYALRALSAEGIEVHLLTNGGALRGVIGRVGKDFCDVHTPTAVMTVGWQAILSVELRA